MTCQYPDLDSALTGWNFLSTNQKHYQDLGSARNQYGISALVTQTSFCEGSSGDLAKRRLFSQAKITFETRSNATQFNLLIFSRMHDIVADH